MTNFPITRLRRLRQTSVIRSLVRETEISTKNLIYPLFIKAGSKIKNPIQSMPGQYQFSLDNLLPEIEAIANKNIAGIILFGIPDTKDAIGSLSYDENGIIQQALHLIKQNFPNLLVITDVCLCEYTDHGHCGVLKDHDVENDPTLALLAKQAVSHAQAGADIIAPSGMMDGMVMSIRSALDGADFKNIPILSYATKFSSALYGPFREAAESTPSFGDRKTYQMDPANRNQGLREANLDLQEGADMLMVKPAGFYLDVLHSIKQNHPGVPLAAYQVSGEYAMIKAAAAQGWINEQAIVAESLLSIKRAGADFIISYFAKEVGGY